MIGEDIVGCLSRTVGNSRIVKIVLLTAKGNIFLGILLSVYTVAMISKV